LKIVNAAQKDEPVSTSGAEKFWQVATPKFGWTETWAAEEELGVLNFRGPEEPMIFLREPGDAEMPTTLTEPR
jgi:hypothetical protein